MGTSAIGEKDVDAPWRFVVAVAIQIPRVQRNVDVSFMVQNPRSNLPILLISSFSRNVILNSFSKLLKLIISFSKLLKLLLVSAIIVSAEIVSAIIVSANNSFSKIVS